MIMQFVQMQKPTEYYEKVEDVPYKITGYTPDQTEIREKGGFTCSPLLDNQPMFEGFLSPMLDGGMLRYETQEVYDLMFD